MFIARYTAAVSRNHVRLTNVVTGETLSRQAIQPFSSTDRIIDDYDRAFAFVGELIRSMESKRRWLRIWTTAEVVLVGSEKAERDNVDVRRIFIEQGFVRVRVT